MTFQTCKSMGFLPIFHHFGSQFAVRSSQFVPPCKRRDESPKLSSIGTLKSAVRCCCLRGVVVVSVGGSYIPQGNPFVMNGFTHPWINEIRESSWIWLPKSKCVSEWNISRYLFTKNDEHSGGKTSFEVMTWKHLKAFEPFLLLKSKSGKMSEKMCQKGQIQKPFQTFPKMLKTTLIPDYYSPYAG